MSTKTTESDDQRYIRILRQQITDLRAQVRTAEDAAESMRERAAQVCDAWSEGHGVADTSDYIGSAIRALPLITDTV